jgi:hypothetical protein
MHAVAAAYLPCLNLKDVSVFASDGEHRFRCIRLLEFARRINGAKDPPNLSLRTKDPYRSFISVPRRTRSR